MSIYTGAGDCGASDTIKDKNISKASPVFEALGSLDECSAALGLAKSYLGGGQLHSDISFIQNRLIEVCGELAGGARAINDAGVNMLERMIDGYSEKCGGFCGFTVSGASPAEAALHLARTIARRAERAICVLDATPEMRKYINRLSDLLCVMAQCSDLN